MRPSWNKADLCLSSSFVGQGNCLTLEKRLMEVAYPLICPYMPTISSPYYGTIEGCIYICRNSFLQRKLFAFILELFILVFQSKSIILRFSKILENLPFRIRIWRSKYSETFQTFSVSCPFFTPEHFFFYFHWWLVRSWNYSQKFKYYNLLLSITE